jgi:Short C-terminal domain
MSRRDRMSRVHIKPKMPKSAAIFTIVFAVIFMLVARSMFSTASATFPGSGFGLFSLLFYLVPIMMIVQAIRALMSKDSTIQGGYVIDIEDNKEKKHPIFNEYNPHQHTNRSNQVEDQLRELKSLRDKGLISEEAYEQQVKDILDQNF